jgi:hypothetical protein
MSNEEYYRDLEFDVLRAAKHCDAISVLLQRQSQKIERLEAQLQAEKEVLKTLGYIHDECWRELDAGQDAAGKSVEEIRKNR